MARMYRMKNKDGVYINPKTANLMLLERVYMSQFFDTKKKELLRIPTATVEAKWIERTHNVMVDQLEEFEYLGRL
jgi:hypothetical protein